MRSNAIEIPSRDGYRGPVNKHQRLWQVRPLGITKTNEKRMRLKKYRQRSPPFVYRQQKNFNFLNWNFLGSDSITRPELRETSWREIEESNNAFFQCELNSEHLFLDHINDSPVWTRNHRTSARRNTFWCTVSFLSFITASGYVSRA